MHGYRDLAAELRQLIEQGEYPPGETLPKITDLMDMYGLARQTVRAAINLLADEGLVTPIRKKGTVVRDRRSFQLALSRYHDVLDPSGPGGGPFETACKAQGLNGFMKLVDVEQVPATEDLATLLKLDADSPLVCRRRDALIDTHVVQVQQAWYPLDVAEAAGLDRQEKVDGGTYRALARAGIPACTADETTEARMPTPEEAVHLGIGTGIPLLTIERVSHNAEGRPIEVLRVVSAGDRMRMTYDALPLVRRDVA